MTITRKILSALLIILILFSGCSKNVSDEKSTTKDTFTIYIVKDTPINSLIKKYNENKANEKRIEIIEFENNAELSSKLNAEIMADDGPDLIYFDSGFGGISNIEKMMSLDMFADYNELLSNDNSDSKINLDNYDKTVMNSGVYNGKRYFMPISYMPDVLITTKEVCDKYSVDFKKSIAYQNVEESLSGFVKESKSTDNMSVFYDFSDEIYKLIDSNMDLFNRKNLLNSDSFLSDIDAIDNLISGYNPSEDPTFSYGLDPLLQGNVVFVNLEQIAGSEPNSIGSIYYYIRSKGQTPIILNSLSNSENTYSAFLDKGLLINKNSDRKSESYEFVKYMLSEKTQCSPEIGLPVNKNARSKLIEEMAETDAKSFGVDYDKDTVDDYYINSYISFLDGINNCSFKNNYFNHSVIGDSVSKYINGEIKKEQFVKEIQGKAEIYLEE